MTPRQQIAEIDKLIDANRATMLRRLRFNPSLSAFDWQRAWDRCPDLYARERSLFRQRGIAQQARDEQDRKDWQREQRRQRAQHRARTKRRPTCGFHTLAA